MRPDPKQDTRGNQPPPKPHAEEPQLLIDSVGETLTPLLVDQADPKKLPKPLNPALQKPR